jgi:hypothetical protein
MIFLGTDADEAEALKRFVSLYDHPDALFVLGALAEAKGDLSAASEFYYQAAVLGSEDGWYALDLLLRKGQEN